MVYISKDLQLKLDNVKKNIDNHSNWMYSVKNQFEYEKISNFDKKKRASRAFYKMMELFRKWKLINNNTKNALCLCEAPGGFIQAIKEVKPSINVFGQSLGNSIKFSNTINPKFYEYSDLYKLENIIGYAKNAKNIGKYDLITSDGGIDVSDDYSLQEVKNLRIIYCQILTMLYCLKVGGNFVIKIFDCFTEETIKLLQLLSYHFENFEIVKPVLSRPCNSEKYVICLGFKGYTKPIFDFTQQINNDTIKFKGITVDPNFYNQMVYMNKVFANNQIKNINEILDICKGKYNAKNINSRRNQLSKSMNMFKNLHINV